jgi:hypothetical protein
MSNSPYRSFESIIQDDLTRLAEIGVADFDDLCRRQEHSRP